ncbi:MAG: hypothetical protein Q9188_003350 [Gyalolechia gomerana]
MRAIFDATQAQERSAKKGLACTVASKDSEEVMQPEEICQTWHSEISRLQAKHVRYLYDFLKPEYDTFVVWAQRLLKDDPPRVAFDMLWYVFKPGTDVYIEKHTTAYAAVVRNVSNEHGSHYYSEHPSGLEYCNLQVWFLDSDGSKIGRVTIRQRIQAYNGLREVTSLDYTGKLVIYLRRDLSRTHSKPPSFGCGNEHCDDFSEYDTIYVNKGDDMGGENSVTESTRTTADLHSKETSQQRKSGPDASEPHEPRDLNDHQLLHLRPKTQAFALKIKEWFAINADYAQEPVPSNESIENLVIGEVELQTIRALSSRQNHERDIWAADFIEGKGTGQIILLHG